MLLHFGADPTVKKKNRCSPLLIIACSDVVELLLKAKVDVNACLEDGTTWLVGMAILRCHFYSSSVWC